MANQKEIDRITKELLTVKAIDQLPIMQVFSNGNREKIRSFKNAAQANISILLHEIAGLQTQLLNYPAIVEEMKDALDVAKEAISLANMEIQRQAQKIKTMGSN